MFGGSFVSAAMSNPWRAQTPTIFLAMFETADGCIKFQEIKEATPVITFAVAFPMVGPGPGIKTKSGADRSDPFDQVHTKQIKRRYELMDRSGPGGMILHYREVAK